MTQIERVPYRLEVPGIGRRRKVRIGIFFQKQLVFRARIACRMVVSGACNISSLLAIERQEANAALPTPAELIAKKLRLDSPSAPGLLSCCSLDRLSRSVPALISCGLLMRVFPVTHTRLCSTDESTRRANLDFHKIFGSPRGQEQCWH